MVDNTGRHPLLGDNYIIFSNGRIYNIKNNRYIKGSVAKNGYRYIRINKISYPIHRIIAETFIYNPDNLPQVNHIDENKLNNDKSNLEWCTHSYNIRYSLSKKVYKYNNKGKLIKIYDSISDVTIDGYSSSSVSRSCNSNINIYANAVWSFIKLDKDTVINRFASYSNHKTYKPKGHVIFK